MDGIDYCSSDPDISIDLAAGFFVGKQHRDVYQRTADHSGKIQWENYRKAFVDGHFLLYLKNSVLINGLAVLLVILVSIMAAFACRRMRWKLSMLVKTLLLMGMMIPIHATLLPNYKIYNMLGLTDTIWALLIPYVAFSLPQGLFLMTSFMESVPV